MTLSLARAPVMFLPCPDLPPGPRDVTGTLSRVDSLLSDTITTRAPAPLNVRTGPSTSSVRQQRGAVRAEKRTASREAQCERHKASREAQCEQGGAVRAERRSPSREVQCSWCNVTYRRLIRPAVSSAYTVLDGARRNLQAVLLREGRRGEIENREERERERERERKNISINFVFAPAGTFTGGMYAGCMLTVWQTSFDLSSTYGFWLGG